MKRYQFSYNLKITIFLDWNKIFSICKSLKSSDFYGEYFRKICKDIFHIWGGSTKSTVKKIQNFRPKFWFWIEFSPNRGLLWFHGVWQNNTWCMYKQPPQVPFVGKFFITIDVKGQCVSQCNELRREELYGFIIE